MQNTNQSKQETADGLIEATNEVPKNGSQGKFLGCKMVARLTAGSEINQMLTASRATDNGGLAKIQKIQK